MSNIFATKHVPPRTSITSPALISFSMPDILGAPKHKCQGSPKNTGVRLSYVSTLRERLNEAMTEAGKAPADLVRACKVAASSINGQLTGKSKSMAAKTAVHAAKLLNVNVRWLVLGEGPKRPGDPVVIYETVFREAAEPDEDIRAVVDIMRSLDVRGRAFLRGMVTREARDLTEAPKTDAGS